MMVDVEKGKRRRGRQLCLPSRWSGSWGTARGILKSDQDDVIVRLVPLFGTAVQTCVVLSCLFDNLLPTSTRTTL